MVATRLTSMNPIGYCWHTLKRFIHLCNRTKQRRFFWLGFLFVAVVTVIFLPFRLDSRTAPVVVIPAEPKPVTDADSMQHVMKEVEIRLITKATNSNAFMDEYSFASGISKNSSEKEDTFLKSWCEKGRILESGVLVPTVSLIFSLYNIFSEKEALWYIRQNFQHISSRLTDDVIITAEKQLSRNIKDVIEDVVELCSFCRLFFLPGNIYKHRNEASKFARHNYLIFLDARIRLTKDWLPPLLKCLQDEVNIVVSPQLRLAYEDNSGHNEGFSRNEVTWDLGVCRGAVSDTLLKTAQRAGLSYINQTIISTEVFGIRKQHFSALGGFDTISDATGGEHVSFSLKVLNCKGNIVTSLCSGVFLTIVNAAKQSGNGTLSDRATRAEFRNPTFGASNNNISAYYIAGSKPWLDSFTTKYYSCASGRQVNVNDLMEMTRSVNQPKTRLTGKYNARVTDVNRYLNSRYSPYGTDLKQHLIRSLCEVSNLRYIISERQHDMIAPTKSATHYGYIRTIDAMYAFGMGANSVSFSKPELIELHADVPRETAWGNFVLTRNTSLWMGPFSFTNGAFVYNNVWCITVGTKLELTLTKCVKGKAAQLFTFTDGLIRPLGITNRCTCARKSANVSNEILMTSCSERDSLKHFKLDVEFTERCIK